MVPGGEDTVWRQSPSGSQGLVPGHAPATGAAVTTQGVLQQQQGGPSTSQAPALCPFLQHMVAPSSRPLLPLLPLLWAVPVHAADWGSWCWWELGSPHLGCGFLRGARGVPGRDFGDVAPSAWDLAAAPAKHHRQRAWPGACPAAPSSCAHAHPQQTNTGSVPGWDFPPRLLSITSPRSRKEPEASSLEAALLQPPGLDSPTTSCCPLLSQGPAGTPQVSPTD